MERTEHVASGHGCRRHMKKLEDQRGRLMRKDGATEKVELKELLMETSSSSNTYRNVLPEVCTFLFFPQTTTVFICDLRRLRSCKHLYFLIVNLHHCSKVTRSILKM